VEIHGVRKIAILVPSYDGKVSCGFSMAMAEIFRFAGQMEGIEIFLRYWMYDSLIQVVRNKLICNALDDGMDEVVFIDADQEFTAETFFRLISHDVDVVGVPVRMKTDDERYNIRPERMEEHRWDPKLKLLDVRAIGTGFLRVTRPVMEAVAKASLEYNDGEKMRRMIFEIRTLDGWIQSEDLVFCHKIRDAGYTIYADIEETCKHFGTKCWSGDFKTYFKNRFIV
jgi:hypothetical protein